MHEGKKLKELLAAAGLSQSDLARAARVDPVSVSRYVKNETLSDEPWENVRRGLRALGIDPNELRPGSEGSTDEVMYLIEPDEWTVEQLRKLEKMLMADHEQQQRLLAYIRGAIMFSKK